MSYSGWGPQAPPQPRQRSGLASGCLVFMGLNVLSFVVMLGVLAFAAIGEGLGLDVSLGGLRLVTSLIVPVGILIWVIRRRRRNRVPSTRRQSREMERKLPQVLANSPDPIAAVRNTSLQYGGGTFIGFVDDGSWISAEPQHAVLVLGPPRSGKTSGIIIPTLLSAVGPVVSTSTKLDVMEATMAVRSRVGTAWLFDPTGQEAMPPGAKQLRWSPVTAARTWDGALLMARSMVASAPATQGGKDDGHWVQKAADLLAPMLHAAALEDKPITQVVRWVMRKSLEEVGTALERHGAEIANDMLVSIATTHEKERSGIFSTAANVLSAYNSDGARQVASNPNFDASAFVRSMDTIYITAPADKQELTAPLVVGLLQDIRKATYERKRTSGAGAQLLPVIFALDECANIAPLHDLPAMVSEAGGQGLHILACFQDLSQVRRRWGDAQADGFLSLFVNKVVLPNIADTRTLESLSVAFGEYDRVMTSFSRGSSYSGHIGISSSTTTSLHRQRVLGAGEIANLPPGKVLFVKGVKWGLVQLTPHFAINPWPAVINAAFAPTTPALPESRLRRPRARKP